jgi:hypothetical protein
MGEHFKHFDGLIGVSCLSERVLGLLKLILLRLGVVAIAKD